MKDKERTIEKLTDIYKFIDGCSTIEAAHIISEIRTVHDNLFYKETKIDLIEVNLGEDKIIFSTTL